MQVTFLGTGAAMPAPGRAQTGHLVEADGNRVLLDCGSGVLGRLAAVDAPGDAEGATWEHLDALLVSHLHLDHVADLLPLLKARWLAGTDTLPIVGPEGTDALLEDIIAAHDYLQGRLDYAVTEIAAGDATTVAGVAIESHPTTHSMPCLAYRLRSTSAATAEPAAAASSLVVTGDTEADADLAAWADGADVLVHDCSFPDGLDVSNHPTPSALGETLAGHEYGTVYLTHLYPMAAGQPGALLAGVREHYGGAVEIASDGQTVVIADGD